jgi:hypothetical protein
MMSIYCCRRADCKDLDCPGRPSAAVARIKRRIPAAEPLPPTRPGRYMRPLARVMLFAIVCSLVGAGAVAFAHEKPRHQTKPSTSLCARGHHAGGGDHRDCRHPDLDRMHRLLALVSDHLTAGGRHEA